MGVGVTNRNKIRNKMYNVEILVKSHSMFSELAFAYQCLSRPQKHKFAPHEKFDFSE